ncbi:MAG: gliding motility protein GldM [Salibacteraceae bacterium]
MAGNKETPRQKMIGMMYLVLTALLALNVSKDILDAFVVVNDGLEENLVSSDQKSSNLYSEFDLAKQVDPVKATRSWQQAQLVKTQSTSVTEFIEALKKELYIKTEGIEVNEADTAQLANLDQKDNYDIPTNLMIGNSEDGSAGKARELFEQLTQYRQSLLELIGDTPENQTNIGLQLSEHPSPEGKLSWEMHHFYHTPLAASITILSKLQNDVKNAEYYTISRLLESVTRAEFPIDTIAAKVMPRSNYVLLGQEYEADVFLAAFSSTRDPEILLGNLNAGGDHLAAVTDSVPVERGLGKLRLPTQREGIFNYQGMINYTTASGEVKHYPFESEYIVARPSLTVSATKMQVFYRGVENPISLSVPGVAQENVSASINGGNQLVSNGDGTYTVKVSRNSPPKVAISVSAKMPDGRTMPMGKVDFRVKRLPTPVAKVGKVTNTALVAKEMLLAYKRVNVVYPEDFDFDAKVRVKSFRMTFILRNGKITDATNSQNGEWTPRMKAAINGLRKGDRVVIDKVMAYGDDGARVEVNSISFTIR